MILTTSHALRTSGTTSRSLTRLTGDTTAGLSKLFSLFHVLYMLLFTLFACLRTLLTYAQSSKQPLQTRKIEDTTEVRVELVSLIHIMFQNCNIIL